MRHRLFGAAGVLAMVLVGPVVLAMQAGQAVPPPQTIPLSKDFAPKPYTVAANDVIQLNFYNLAASDADMKTRYTVQADGTIVLKHVGALNVNGKTLQEIQVAVLGALVPKFYQEGVISVDVTIVEERLQAVTIQGQVNNPGEKQLRGTQMTVSRAITAAGSFSASAGSEIEVRRVGPDGRPVSFTLTRAQLDDGEDPQLMADDTVIVKQGQFFFVNGEVQSPGRKMWEVGMTVQKAIALSGGMTTKGKLGHIVRPIKDAEGKVLKYDKIKGLKLETPILPDDDLKIDRKWFGG